MSPLSIRKTTTYTVRWFGKFSIEKLTDSFVSKMNGFVNVKHDAHTVSFDKQNKQTKKPVTIKTLNKFQWGIHFSQSHNCKHEIRNAKHYLWHETRTQVPIDSLVAWLISQTETMSNDICQFCSVSMLNWVSDVTIHAYSQILINSMSVFALWSKF